MKKVKVAIISGGPSSEHEVSVNSAKNVINNLSHRNFDILDIKISKEGIWVDQKTLNEHSEAEAIEFLKKSNVNLVFIILHGEYGEDGTIQKLFESHGLRYTGSNSVVSKIAMDKVDSSQILTAAKMNVPPFVSLNHEEWILSPDKYIREALKSFSLPLVVKPTDRGSSVGTTIVFNEETIQDAIELAFKSSNNVMIQKYIKGRELTCAVVENGDQDIALMPTEIIPNNEISFFDYKAKYVPGASLEVTPPNLSKKMIKEIQDAALLAHAAIGCRHISRADFILSEGTLYILELNTIPGLTETSLLPKGAKASGIEFPLLLEIIIEAALK